MADAANRSREMCIRDSRYNDFSGMALNGFDWTGAELQQCTFDDTRLAGASFYGVRLGGTRCV